MLDIIPQAQRQLHCQVNSHFFIKQNKRIWALGQNVARQIVADKSLQTIRRTDNSLHGQMVAWTIRRRDKSSHRQIVARINSCGQNVEIFSGAKSTDFLENDDKE